MRPKIYLIAFAFAMSACAQSSRVPSASSRRSLLLPPGVIQFSLGGGVTNDLSDGDLDPAFDFHYGVGFTENFGLRAPVLASYGVRLADDLELSLAAGIMGFGLRAFVAPFSGDPRVRPPGGEQWMLDVGGTFGGRWALGGTIALLADGYFQQPALGTEGRVAAVGGRGALLIDLDTWISLGAGVLYQAGLGGGSQLVIGGDFHSSGVGVPLVALHFWDNADIVLNGSVIKAIDAEVTVVRALVGINAYLE